MQQQMATTDDSDHGGQLVDTMLARCMPS
jgi:hypothetical protein